MNKCELNSFSVATLLGNFSQAIMNSFVGACIVGIGVTAGHPVSAQKAGAVFLNGINEIEYAATSNLAQGDTVDIYGDPMRRERCMEVGAIEPDIEGSTEASLRLYLVTSYSDLEEKMGAKLSTTLASEASFFSMLSAKSSLTASGSFDDFVKNTEQSVMLVLEARGAYGRDIIREIGLKDEYRSLQTEDPSEFRRICGTHFIRGVRKESRLRVIYRFSGLSKQAKNTVTGQFKANYEAGVKLTDFGGKIKADISANFTRTVNVASRLGNTSVEVQTVGGEGIATVGKAIAGSAIADANQASVLIDALVQATDSFTYSNAKPIAFLIAQHATVFTDIDDSKSVDFSVLKRFHRALLRVDSIRERYESYRQANPDLWNRYFRVQAEEADSVREQVVQLLRDCRLEAECDTGALDSLTLVGLSLDDVLIEGRLSGICNHSNFLPVAQGGDDFSTLSSIQVEWDGRAQFLDSVDIMGTEVFKLGVDLELADVPFNFGQFGRLDRNQQGGTRRVFLAVDSVRVPDETNEGGVANQSKLLEFRNEVAQTLYVARVYFRNGLVSEIPLGLPDLSGCELVR